MILSKMIVFLTFLTHSTRYYSSFLTRHRSRQDTSFGIRLSQKKNSGAELDEPQCEIFHPMTMNSAPRIHTIYFQILKLISDLCSACKTGSDKLFQNNISHVTRSITVIGGITRKRRPIQQKVAQSMSPIQLIFLQQIGITESRIT